MGYIKASSDMKKEYFLPNRIVFGKNCTGADNLLKEYPRQALIGSECRTRISPGGFVLLDFDEEIQGGAIITVQRATPSTSLRVVFGESVSEALSDCGEKNSQNAHSIRDDVYKITSWQNFRVGETGFRFLKLEVQVVVVKDSI